jgi:hypothetical protein
MSDMVDKYSGKIKGGVATIRIRTWTLTLAVIIALVFYFLMNVILRQSFDFILFCLLVVLQILIHCLYFPDGEIFGAKDKTFVANREAYNAKATLITDKQRIEALSDFCDYDYEQRKDRWVKNECGAIGITLEDLEEISMLDAKQIKTMTTWTKTAKLEDGTEQVVKAVHFTRKRRKRLCKLVFDECPVERNEQETILSALKNDANKAISDKSIRYKEVAYTKRILQAVVFGVFFAFIGYTLKNGIGWEQVASMVMCITTMFTTGVISFSEGEVCKRVYKSNFYLELGNFIDRFFEWDLKRIEKSE